MFPLAARYLEEEWLRPQVYQKLLQLQLLSSEKKRNKLPLFFFINYKILIHNPLLYNINIDTANALLY